LALPSGTVLRGEITQIDGRGNAVLSTPKGDVSLQTALAIKLGSEVALRLTTSSEGVQARVLSVNGLSPKEFAEQSAIPRGQQIQVDDIVQTGKESAAPDKSASVPVKETVLTPTTTNQPAATNVAAPATSVPNVTQPLSATGVLLARGDAVGQLLAQLPSSLNIPSQRLEPGMKFTFRVIPSSIVLPTATNSPATNTAVSITTQPGQAATNTASASSTITQSTTTPNNPNVAATLSATNTVSTTSAGPVSQSTPATTTTPTSNLASSGNPASTLAPASTASTTVPNLPTANNAAATPTSTSSGQSVVSTPTPANAPAATPSNPASPTVSVQNTTTQQALPTTSPANVTNSPSVNTLTAASNSPVTAASTPVPTGNVPGAQPTTPGAVPSATPALQGQATPSASVPTQAQAPASGTVQTNNITAPIAPSTLPTLPPTTPANLAAGIIPAQLIGQEASGEAILKTALGNFRITLPATSNLPANPPVGTQLQLQIEQINLPQAINQSLPITTRNEPAPISELSMQWQNLREVVEVLNQSQPALAAQILEQVIPKPGPKMAASMLFFVSALRGGDIRQWLGDKTIEALEQQQRGDLIRKLGSEFASLRQFFTESPSLNWQAMFVPVFDQDQWQQARLFLKKETESGADQEAGGTRFIMEVELTHLGPMQFDGLVRRKAATPQFDLIIRSAQTLSQTDQQNIREIYQSASELTGFKGGISFQTITPFPIQPMQEMLDHTPDIMA
jgi:hypothetical protein